MGHDVQFLSYVEFVLLFECSGHLAQNAKFNNVDKGSALSIGRSVLISDEAV